MIDISFIGLDQFIVADISKAITPTLAKTYKVDEEDINFIAPNNMYFHKGVEQTSWNTLVRVSAPHQFEIIEREVAEVIDKGIGENAIHVTIEFNYYEDGHHYERIDDDYPRYMTEENMVELDGDEEEGEEIEGDDDDDFSDIYTGDIFKDFNKTH
ncbi:MAG: hypothetical protein LUB56_02630 [Coprobacillus sp.]|nr:hypothetical protein [Coprobacillus sp.]